MPSEQSECNNGCMHYRLPVRVSDNLFTLAQRVALDLIWPATGVPGFVHFGNGGALIATGIAGGLVEVEFRLLETEPKLESERWADIDEGDLATETGRVRLTSGFESKNYIPGGRDGVTPPGASLHRVRISANGRGRNYDLVTSDTDTPEMYLIEMWPTSTLSRTVVVKHTSGR